MLDDGRISDNRIKIGIGSVIKCTDPKIMLRTKMSRIWNTAYYLAFIWTHYRSGLFFFFRKRGGSAESNDEDNTDGEEEEEKDTEPELTDKEESGGEDPEPAAKRHAALRIQDEDSDHTQELFPDDLWSAVRKYFSSHKHCMLTYVAVLPFCGFKVISSTETCPYVCSTKSKKSCCVIYKEWYFAPSFIYSY